MKFTIRDLLWLTVVVAMGVGWWREHRLVQAVREWWPEHVLREHGDNPNDYKRLIEREGPPVYSPLPRR